MKKNNNNKRPLKTNYRTTNMTIPRTINDPCVVLPNNEKPITEKQIQTIYYFSKFSCVVVHENYYLIT